MKVDDPAPAGDGTAVAVAGCGTADPRRAGVIRIVRGADLVALLASGLLAGAVVVVALIDAVLAPQAWIGFHQDTTGVLTAALPPLGGLALLATLVAAALRRPRRLHLIVVLFLVAGLAVTVAVHFPLNAQIAGWSAAVPPPAWEQVRERWWLGHAVRTVATLIAFTLLALVPVQEPAAVAARERS